MRKKIIAGNWKMNKTPREARELIEVLKPLVAVTEKADVVFCPSFVCLGTAVDAVQGTGIEIGAQNLLDKDSGAYTGEVAPGMLKDIGCTYVILGHSERRAYFGETDRMVNAKVHKAFEYGLKPIICVGETLEQREQNVSHDPHTAVSFRARRYRKYAAPMAIAPEGRIIKLVEPSSPGTRMKRTLIITSGSSAIFTFFR